MVYTKIEHENFSFTTPSPTLLYHKWQGYDRFTVEHRNNRRLKAFSTDQQKDYLKKIIEYVNQVKEEQSGWIEKYLSNISALSSNVILESFTTNWRLIVGMGTNPTLETGLQLHHLYGFPYIPGSMVKGLLHHVAELELCQSENWKLDGEDSWQQVSKEKKEKFHQALARARLIRILFGSVFITRYKNKKNNQFYGLETPLEWFKEWKEKIFDKMNEKEKEEIQETITALKTIASEDHTGGMLTFFDAVPDEDAFNDGELLQLDIMNPHYQDYYSDDKGTTPPSDDQNPNPIYFLAVKPGVKFVFPYRIADFPLDNGWRDVLEEERWNVLQKNDINNLEDIQKLVNHWFEAALTEWGVGAKTAAGYGYFMGETSDVKQEKEKDNANQAESNPDNLPPGMDVQETTHLTSSAIKEKKPKPFSVGRNYRAQISGINKNYGQHIWNQISENAHIKRIVGENCNARPRQYSEPIREIGRNGKILIIYYYWERFNCQVKVELQGVDSPGEAEYIWKNEIQPKLTSQNNE